MPQDLFSPFTIGLITASLLTPLVSKVAVGLGKVSLPNLSVDGHTRATPYLGGVAIFCAAFPFILHLQNSLWTAGVVLMTLVGLVDDLAVLSPIRKLLGQVAASGIVVWGGVRLEVSGLVPLDIGLTVIWMLWIVNAFNVTDMMDGLAAGVGGIASLGFALALVWVGSRESSVIAAALSGGLFGFLVHNFHPARSFMGDTGSLFVGCLLGILGVVLAGERSVIIPVILLGLPLFEAIFLVVVRWRQGRRWYLASRDHTAQRLVQSGCSIREAVLILYGAGLLCGSAALFVFRMPISGIYATMCVVLMVAMIAGWRLSKVKMKNQNEEPELKIGSAGSLGPFGL